MNNSIRRRVALALLLWSSASALAFAAATYWAADIMELLVLEQNLGATATRIKQAVEQGEKADYPSQSWYWGGPESQLNLPDNLSELPTGSYHDVMIDGREHHVWVDQLPGERLFLIYDLAEIERYESRLLTFLFGCVVLLGLFGIASGLKGTAWVMRPLDDLAKRLQQSPPGAEKFSAPQAHDQDLAPMVTAIDTLMQRNKALVERESHFTRIASHELRNPLATLGAALELLAQQADAQQQAALQRAQRASARMNDIVAVLLQFSRQEASARAEDSHCLAAPVIQAQIEEAGMQFPDHPPIQADLDQALNLPIAPSLLGIIVANLLRNAIQHGANSPIAVRLSSHKLCISNDTQEKQAHDSADRLGLGIVDLMCGYQSWRFERCVNNGKFVARIVFSKPST